MVEGIGPELDGKVCTMKHSTECICDGEMCVFNRSILVQRISASQTEIVVVLFEELADFWVMVQFPSLIHVDVFVRTMRRIVCKKVPKPLNGRGLGDMGFTNIMVGEVVSDQDPTGFTIETEVIFDAFTILGLGTRE